MKITQKLGLAASLAGALMLAACGGDSNSGDSNGSEEQGGVASVATFDDLAHCTKSHYGEIVFVEEESTYFECTSEDWAEMDESKLDSLLAAASSSSEADEDKPKSSSSVNADSSEIATVETKKVDSVTVSGFAQKGPFASGSAVTVYGLDNLLEKTKTKFTGKIAGDSGYFKIEKIALPSQFALVEVSGYYQNEVTGKKTSGTKTTLSALVDLSEGKTVKANVNLFTELEYARAKNLVLKEKFNVPAAKKRATKELLAVFGGKGDENLTATSLSLSDTTAAGRALLYASILLQGDLSAGKFGQRLSDAAELFATSGTLDDAETLAAMADWASKTDSTDNFAAIRENVKAMKLVETVPDFESALYAFWTDVYGLVECTDSLESTIKKNENKLSDKYGAGYACTAKHWHKATALDTELGLCTGKMEGSFKEYKGGKSTEYYVCRTGTWQQITETQFELKECTEKRESEYVAAKSGEYFVCTDKQWLELDAVTYELKLCTEKRDMEIATTKKSESYVCEWDGKKGSWRKASDIEAELGVCGSKANPDSSIGHLSAKHYACMDGEWTEIDEATAKLGFCTASLKDSVLWTGDFTNGRPDESTEGKYYTCNGTEWIETTKLHYVFGATCDVFKNRIQRMYAEYPNYFSNYSVENNIVEDGSIAGTSKYVGLFNPAWSGYVDMWTYEDTVYSNVLCKDDHYTLPSAGITAMRKFCTANNLGERDRSKHLGSDIYSNSAYICYANDDGSYEWGQALLDARDGAIYRMVTIGEQTWMAENLNYSDSVTYVGMKKRSWCYNNSVDSCAKYGRLYTWAAAIDSAGTWSTTTKGCGYVGRYDSLCTVKEPVRGICPEGWHIPTKAEWKTLITAMGIIYPNLDPDAMQAKGFEKWDRATDAFGFSALPAGDYANGSFHDGGSYAFFWCAADANFDRANVLELNADRAVDQNYDKGYGFSVRCIKDE